MKHLTKHMLPVVAFQMAVPAMAAKEVKTTSGIVEVPFTQIHFSDRFWVPRIDVNHTVSIPSAFRECEKEGRFDNFALAAKNNGN